MKFAYYKSLILKNLPGSVGLQFRRKYDRCSTDLVNNQFIEAVSQLNDQSIALDLGANVGKYTIMLAEKCEVYAFEPDPLTFAKLTTNVSAYDNVHTFQAAVGTSDKLITMYRHADFQKNPDVLTESTTIYKEKKNVSQQNSIEVQQIDVIRFMLDLDRDIDIIKMDIEGAEIPILESLLESPIRERIHRVFVETHEFKIPELLERTEAVRRKIEKIKRPKFYMNWR